MIQGFEIWGLQGLGEALAGHTGFFQRLRIEGLEPCNPKP